MTEPKATDADLAYLRNIRTRPGPGAGQKIDPTKPGPRCEKAAELERKIAELEAANEATPTWGWGAAVGARWESIKRLRAELARLRNESPALPSECDPRPISAGQYSGCVQSVTDAILSAFPALAQSSYPAGNADPRVREALERALRFIQTVLSETKEKPYRVTEHDHIGLLRSASDDIRAALALSSPQSQGLVEAAERQRSGIYIASKTKHADRWRLLRDKIGLPIKSTWIDEAGEGETSDFADIWRRNISEASSAEVLIINREKDEVLKGAWIEVGAALVCGVPVYAVGIEEFTIAKANGITHFRHMRDAIAAATKLVFRSRTSDRSAT